MRTNHWKINKKGVSRGCVHLQCTPRWNAHAPARVQQARKSLSIEQRNRVKLRNWVVGRKRGREAVAARRMEIGSPSFLLSRSLPPSRVSFVGHFASCFIYIWRKIRSNVMYCLEKNVSCYKCRWMLIVFVLTKLEIVSRSCFLKRRLELGGSKGKRNDLLTRRKFKVLHSRERATEKVAETLEGTQTTIRVSTMRKYTHRGMNSGRLSSPLAEQRHGRKKGGEQVRARCLLRHRGYILGPFEGCTGPVLCAQSQLLLWIRRGCIYTPFFSTSSQRKPPFLSSLGWAQRMRKSRGRFSPRLLGGCEWETRRTGSGYSRMWARCLGNCSGKRHLLIGMYQVRAEVIGCREIKIVGGNCASFLGSD